MGSAFFCLCERPDASVGSIDNVESAFSCASQGKSRHHESYSTSSIERGQLFFNSRDRARSARIFPPVWQRAQ